MRVSVSPLLAGESLNGSECWNASLMVKSNDPPPPSACLTISIVARRTFLNVHVTWSPYERLLRSRLVPSPESSLSQLIELS